MAQEINKLQPISFSVMKYLFALCAGIVALAGFIFAYEILIQIFVSAVKNFRSTRSRVKPREKTNIIYLRHLK